MIKPILDAQETIKGMKILINIRPFYDFIEQDGKKVKTEKIGGYSYECVAIEKKFEKFIVKIEHATPLFSDNKLIPDQCVVEFKNITGSTYIAGNDHFKYIACSFRAEDVYEVVEDD